MLIRVVVTLLVLLTSAATVSGQQSLFEEQAEIDKSAKLMISLGLRSDFGKYDAAPEGIGYKARAYLDLTALWLYGGVDYMASPEVGGENIGRSYTWELGLRFHNGRGKLTGWVEIGLANVNHTTDVGERDIDPDFWAATGGLGLAWQIDPQWGLDIGWHGLFRSHGYEERIVLDVLPGDDLNPGSRGLSGPPFELNQAYLQLSVMGQLRFAVL